MGCLSQKVFIVIFVPVWVDTYGGKNKTSWLAYIQVCTPIGVSFGYIIAAIFNTLNAEYGVRYLNVVCAI